MVRVCTISAYEREKWEIDLSAAAEHIPIFTRLYQSGSNCVSNVSQLCILLGPVVTSLMVEVEI